MGELLNRPYKPKVQTNSPCSTHRHSPAIPPYQRLPTPASPYRLQIPLPLPASPVPVWLACSVTPSVQPARRIPAKRKRDGPSPSTSRRDRETDGDWAFLDRAGFFLAEDDWEDPMSSPELCRGGPTHERPILVSR
jgi:hypothetical protein